MEFLFFRHHCSTWNKLLALKLSNFMSAVEVKIIDVIHKKIYATRIFSDTHKRKIEPFSEPVANVLGIAGIELFF